VDVVDEPVMMKRWRYLGWLKGGTLGDLGCEGEVVVPSE